MKEGLNRVMLLGHLGQDPELRMTPSGQAVLNMRLATTESYLDRNKVRQERTEWHSIALWGKRAEALSKYLTKGTGLFIEGGLRTRSYEDRDGNKRYRTEVVATNVIFVGGAGGRGDRRPAEPGGPPAEEAPAAAGGGYDDADYGGGDDDIPF